MVALGLRNVLYIFKVLNKTKEEGRKQERAANEEEKEDTQAVWRTQADLQSRANSVHQLL